MTDNRNLLAEVLQSINVDDLIKASVRKSTQDLGINESFVAQVKPYSQVTQFVSQKTKDAHKALYEGYVETVNRVSAELDSVTREEADSKHSDYRSLKLDETYNLNAVWLHELYFAAFFDPHSEIYMDSSAYIELERTFGTFDDWQKDFVACALASGQGWAVCGYNLFLKQYVNTFVSCHSQDVMLGLVPILALDMHEHSYFKDYQTDKKSYVIAMMRQIDWNVVEERVKKTKTVAEALK